MKEFVFQFGSVQSSPVQSPAPLRSHLLGGCGGNNLDTTGIKPAASEAIASVDSIIFVATKLTTIGGISIIPSLRVGRACRSFPGRAVPGQDVCVEEVL